MKQIEKKVDFHAHIANLTYEMKVEDTRYIELSFQNVSGKKIETVELRAKGYDYFGDTIQVEGEGNFPIVLDHVNLEPGAMLFKRRVDISDKIRKIDIIEESVVFEDKTRCFYEGPAYEIYYFDSFLKDSYRDKPQLDMLREFDERACCYPKEHENGWICSCGYLNPKEHDRCANCNHTKEDILRECNEIAINAKIKESHRLFAERMKKLELERIKNERMYYVRFVLWFVVVVAVLVAIFWLFMRVYFL